VVVPNDPVITFPVVPRIELQGASTEPLTTAYESLVDPTIVAILAGHPYPLALVGITHEWSPLLQSGNNIALEIGFLPEIAGF
jgi:hypothetical protein